MHKSYLIQLYPNKDQAILLDKNFGCARWIYNEMIRINQKVYHRTGKGLSSYEMSSYLPKLKKQYPWLKEVNSQSLQVVCHNLANAYNNFFKKKSRYPVFKKKNSINSFSTINNSSLLEKHIKLSKFGLIKYRGGDQPEGEVKNFTIKKNAGKYYASILVETVEELPEEKPINNILGIDLGIKDIAVTSSGDVIKAPKFFRKQKIRLREAQKNLSRCQKGSKRRAKARLIVAIIHAKIKNQRKDFNHKITRSLVNKSENQTFAIEDLNVKGMMANHKLAGAIADSGWYQFKTFLKYKAAAVGKPVIGVGRFYPSSKTCSACGIVNKSLTLKQREWVCECGAKHHRDINAAINIASEAARSAVRGDGVIPNVLRMVTICEAKSS